VLLQLRIGRRKKELSTASTPYLALSCNNSHCKSCWHQVVACLPAVLSIFIVRDVTQLISVYSPCRFGSLQSNANLFTSWAYRWIWEDSETICVARKVNVQTDLRIIAVGTKGFGQRCSLQCKHTVGTRLSLWRSGAVAQGSFYRKIF